MTIKAMPNSVLVEEIERGERMAGRIILRNDDGKSHGVRARWAKVFAVGEGVDEVNAGEYVLLKHGRWTRGFKVDDDHKVFMIDYPDAVLLSAEEIPEDWGTILGEETLNSEQLRRDGELTDSEKALNISEI